MKRLFRGLVVCLLLVGCGKERVELPFVKKEEVKETAIPFDVDEATFKKIIRAVFEKDNILIMDQEDNDVTQDFKEAMQENYEKGDYDAMILYWRSHNYKPFHVVIPPKKWQ